MTPEERQVITEIFERLKVAENHPRDPEAEKLIADLVAGQPYAPYAMAQLIYVNEQALTNLNERVEELGRQLQEAQAQPRSSGFLSSLFGGPRPEMPRGAASAPPRYPEPRQGFGPGQQAYPPAAPMPGFGQQPGLWGGQPQGGGFLHNAMSTAAGVAGGMVLANALTSAFSHHGAGVGSGFGSLGSTESSPISANSTSAQGFGDTAPAGRQDGFAQDSGGSFGAPDHGGVQSASYDGSSGADGLNDPSFDDSGSFDDGGFSGDV